MDDSPSVVVFMTFPPHEGEQGWPARVRGTNSNRLKRGRMGKERYALAAAKTLSHYS